MNRDMGISLDRHFLKQAAHRVISFAGQLLFPSKCVKCGTYFKWDLKSSQMIDRYFCSSCHTGEIPFITKPYCTTCGIPFAQKTLENHYCENCLKTPMALGKVRAAVAYTGIAKDAVSLFKYQAKLSVTPLFESWLYPCFNGHFKERQFDIIMPVPLHHTKTKARGFNQAYLLVRHFEAYLNTQSHGSGRARVDLTSVVRTKKTKTQTGYDIRQRKKNLESAFKVVDPSRIKDKDILLVDDVFTTGATCNELALELLKNGAKRVDALVLARA